MRSEYELYPDFNAEIKAIETEGISPDLLNKIINKHLPNAEYNKKLFNRYRALDVALPIRNREPRFKAEAVNGVAPPPPINNKINNDFFGEIVDFKTGYFAGKPFIYNYSDTDESEEDTGGAELVEEAKKALSDFVARNNMYDVDMETTKYASIYGYAGRLFYHDKDGEERVMVVHGFETIILSRTNIAEPQYAIRYYTTEDINGREYWKVEFYDDTSIQYYEGQLGSLNFVKKDPNYYDFCPLQGIANNNELMGDAEKVLPLIDEYDKTVSDCSNEIEGNVHSKTVYENVNVSDEEIQKSNYTGAIKFFNGTGNGKVYKLETNINDNFVQNHLGRIEDNIYRFSKTPNLEDDTFTSASGIALKFKLTGHETKCGMFQAKMMTASVYMFKLLASSWRKRKQLIIDPLQCYMDCSKRNFPLDLLSEAKAAQQLIASGVPKEIAYTIALSCVDDIDYLMQKIEEEIDNIPMLEEDDEDEDIPKDKEDKSKEEDEE